MLKLPCAFVIAHTAGLCPTAVRTTTTVCIRSPSTGCSTPPFLAITRSSLQQNVWHRASSCHSRWRNRGSRITSLPSVAGELNRSCYLLAVGCHTSARCLIQNGSPAFDISKSNIRSTVCSDRRLAILTTRQHRITRSTRSSVRNLTLSTKGIVEASPLSLQPYLRLIRLDRPIGTWLLFLPSAWSLSLASPAGQLPDVRLVALFGLGSFLMRSAGCTINDMWDKDFDSRVERTKDRPIACGQISRTNALAFLAVPLSLSLGILLTLNSNTVLLGFCAVLPCVIYPLMKRVTYWPQAFLGLTFNYGVLMAWSAVRGSLEWPVLPLYLSCIAWTLLYDTIYAFQDCSDDRLIGVKSLALRLNDSARPWFAGFASFMSAGLVTTGLMCDQTWPYYLGVAVFSCHLGHQIYSVDLSKPESCGSKFRSNRDIGLIFWAFIVAAGLYGTRDKKSTTAEELSPIS